MRLLSNNVARQLHSVAARFHHPLSRRSAGLRRRVDTDDPQESPRALQSLPAVVSGRDERLRRVEAILFLSREPLSSRRLSQYANLADATEARTLVRHLNEILDNGGRAFRVEEVAGGFQLLTRPKFATWLRRLANVPKELRLSAPALETLAVVAYRQPAGRAEIEAVRGVNCGEIVRQLMERDLVRIAGRSEELGRPYLYATTRRFLQLFGLRSLDDLPRAEQLRKQSSTQSSNRQSTDTTEIQDTTDSPDRNEEESDVTATIRAELSPEELRRSRLGGIPVVLPRASDDDFEEEDDDDDDDDDDDEIEDLEDEEDDLEDEEEDELDDLEDEEDDLEEDEWEEVDDEDEEDDLDEDDDDWDDEDDEEEEEEDEDWE